ncbi:hypothetical protein [Microvirga sp. Mcv34]|uniref:hypothetical protein n=1 Tax=Microvirga sp. Mcv34 TaxID=2926016 RepID=UPI0021C78443|nr:hypothetical protein [Microvirga sp. Mcv34]
MTGFRGLIRNRIIWAATAAFGVYWILAAIIPNDEWLAFLRSLLLIVSLAVAIAYSRPVLFALAHHQYDRVIHLTLGITLGWIATLLSSLWGLIWRISGQPAWMLNNDIVGAFFWLQFLAAVLHLTAPGAVDGKVPTRSWLLVGVTIAGGLGMAIYLAGKSADLRLVIDAIEPFIPH